MNQYDFGLRCRYRQCLLCQIERYFGKIDCDDDFPVFGRGGFSYNQQWTRVELQEFAGQVAQKHVTARVVAVCPDNEQACFFANDAGRDFVCRFAEADHES